MDRSGLGDSLLHPKNRFSLSSFKKGGLLNDSRRQVKSSLSGKSAQSNQIIHRSQLHTVEAFGGTLPVLVREALTFSEKNTDVSVRLSNDGWVWFVFGRRLLIWQCKFDDSHEEGRRRYINTQCRELSLPSSDLAYKAELVVVYTAPGNQVPSCIAVSPEGIIRYWPSIAHEGSSVEVNAELQGQECDSFTDISPIGCVLATTSATVVLVQPQMSGGRYSIVCRPFKLSQSWLKGIGRLIPSLLFGSIQSSHIMETKLVKITAVKSSGYDSCKWMLYILAGHSLQKWILVGGELERLVFECDVNQLALDAFQKTIWEPSGGNPNEIQVWLLDMHPTEGGVTILLAGTNPQISPQFYYALGTLLTNSLSQPSRFDRFCPLKNTGFYRESDEPELLNYRFLMSRNTALLYKPKCLVAVSAINFGDEMDNIDFLGQNDRILGGAICRGIPVFFSVVHGLVSVLPSDDSRLEISNLVIDLATVDASSTSLMSGEMNVAISDFELEDLSLSKDSVVQLKAAFLYFIRRNMEMAENIVGSLFPYEESAMQIDARLDLVVSKVAQDIINDIPAGDPRWANKKSSNISLGSSVSLQIINQLEDKQRALEWYFGFLKEIKIWERLSAITIRETTMMTTSVLGEYAEKITAAIALKNLHSSHSSLIEQCIKQVVGHEQLNYGLTYQDLFYREVSRIVEGLQVFTQWSENLCHSNRRPQEIAMGLCEANTVFLSVLWEILQWRKQKGEVFSFKSSFTPKSCEYLPWTAAPNSEGLRDSITLQHSLTLKYAARSTGELEMKNRFYEQLVSLTDILLDGRRSHVNSVRCQPKYEALFHQYEASRSTLIKPFLEDGHYEQAAVLAEKYHDFHSLIQICEFTNNIERLDSYCEKFSDENFSQFLFNWYIRERKPGRLLQQFRERSKPQKQKKDLSKFLSNHPSLSWLQDIFSSQFKQASNTLHELAEQETELLSRKKTMLSLAKLSALACEEEERPDILYKNLCDFDSELELVAHQEDLPANVLVAYGHDVTRLGVLTPVELIKLYICEENENINEVDFKKALDLLDYVEDDLERNELRHSIWCTAILRDSWKDIDSDSSIDNILNLLFFKLADLVEFMGGSPEEFLPPLNTILEAPELGDLKNDRHFQYLIRLGYEHFLKSANGGEQFNP